MKRAIEAWTKISIMQDAARDIKEIIAIFQEPGYPKAFQPAGYIILQHKMQESHGKTGIGMETGSLICLEKVELRTTVPWVHNLGEVITKAALHV